MLFKINENVNGVRFDSGIEFILVEEGMLNEIPSLLENDRNLGLILTSRCDFDLEMLKSFNWLKHVRVLSEIDCNYLISLLPSLEYLEVQSDSELHDISSLKSLEFLFCKFNKKLTGLDSCRELKRLTLKKVNTKSITNLKLPTSLEFLEISQGTLSSLDGLSYLTSLTTLKCNYLTKLQDIECLLKSESIRELSLYACRKALDLDVLKELSGLRKLDISNNKEIDSISFVKNLTQLEWLTFVTTVVLDNNTKVILDLPNIKYAGFDNKRSYNLTFDECQILLANR